MAVMGGKKQMVRRIILNRRAKQRDEVKISSKAMKEEVPEEEHRKRMSLLKDIGLIK